MRRIARWWPVHVFAVSVLLAGAFSGVGGAADDDAEPAPLELVGGAGEVAHPSVSPNISEAAPTHRAPKVSDRFILTERERFPGKILEGSADDAGEARVQASQRAERAPAPNFSFDGAQNADNQAIIGGSVVPPDTVGDVGPNHYVQMTNLVTEIFDKSGNTLVGPFSNDIFWANNAGTPCQSTNQGDPIVVYDPLANRWVVSQFAFNVSPAGQPVGPFYECIAVSQTADPTQTYWAYAFLVNNVLFEDYPKLGVWPDAYYMTANQFLMPSGSFAGVGLFAFDRNAMLIGQPAAQVFVDVGAKCTTGAQRECAYGAMLPSDVDGPTPPPAGSPNYVVGTVTYTNGTAELDVLAFKANFSNPPGVYTPATVLQTNVGNMNICNFGGSSCIPQPGTAQGLDSLALFMMQRLPYRNFGTHESIVATHVVNAGAGRAGMHWYELRKTGAAWTMRQNATFGPAGLHRWMGSIAMDKSGNIALGYSASSSTTSPSVYYTGRDASDPLGTMQAEQILVAGAGSQTDPSGRWGDYSAMSVDPADDCTFWYTQEYYSGTSARGWKTRIGSFTFPSCGAPPPPPQSYTLTAKKKGKGKVRGPGIRCGADCKETFLDGTSVTLNAKPKRGWKFARWRNACSGKGQCVVLMNSNKTAKAIFKPI